MKGLREIRSEECEFEGDVDGGREEVAMVDSVWVLGV